MKKTKPLGSLKGIFPPINTPRPLSKRDSQRLLDTVKTSFRTQLDKEHGWTELDRSAILPATKSGFSSKPSSSTAFRVSPPPSAPRNHVASTRPTDRHMSAILGNPLFSTSSLPKITKASETPLEAHSAIFEKAASRGLMTIPRAQGFLMLVKSEVKKSKYVWLMDALKSTGAGLLVLRWLRSSGQEARLTFLNHAPFRELLLQFIVAEGLDAVALSWFDRLMREEISSGHTDKFTSRAGTLLRDLVKAKSRGSELEGAYAAMVNAHNNVLENRVNPAILYQAWTALAWETTLNSGNRTKPPVDLFDSFVAMGVSVQPPLLDVAHINLHRPVDPSARLALHFLKGKDVFKQVPAHAAEESWSRVLIQPCSSVERYVHQLKFLGLDTIQHLQQTNKMEEASRLWRLLETKLGLRIPPSLALGV